MDNKEQQRLQEAVVDGTVWSEFCDQLKVAGEVILKNTTPSDAFNRAEGFRYLTRLLRAGLESNIESSDPQFPRFFQLANETIKIGNDNPDNIYHNANLDGTMDYVISGNRGTVSYISFGTKAGDYATTGTMEPTGQLELSDLQVDADGSFEIVVSSKPQPNNWLPMREDTTALIVRQTFRDRATEAPASYRIARSNATADNTLQPAVFAQQLQRSANFVAGTANLFVDWMENYSAHINQLPADDQERCQRAGGDAAIHYLQSYWKLAPDEALLIQARTIPRCSTWNFQLSNFWMESLDYRYHRISLNAHTAQYNADGSVTVVVAHRDPGTRYPNWLTTADHDQGGMLWRWIEAADHPPLECRVVPLESLRNGEVL